MIRPVRLALTAGLLVLAGPGPAPARDGLPGPVPGTVVRVIDGDSLVVEARIWLDQVVTTNVRLANADAPELNGRCADERTQARAARARLTALATTGTPVALHAIATDKYGGRIAARIALPDGTDLGDLLIAEGHARPYGGGRREAWCAR